MKKLINPKPHFIPYDICRVVGTQHLVIITEINCNTCQIEDKHQWCYSVVPIDGSARLKSAWYDGSELEYLNNIFEIIAKKSVHPFGNKRYKFDISDKRRNL